MATREENFKKINDKLEQLSDEQLEQIAGGLLVATVLTLLVLPVMYAAVYLNWKN